MPSWYCRWEAWDQRLNTFFTTLSSQSLSTFSILLNLNICLADTADERHGIALVIIAVAAERRPTSRDCARVEKPCSKKKTGKKNWVKKTNVKKDLRSRNGVVVVNLVMQWHLVMQQTQTHIQRLLHKEPTHIHTRRYTKTHTRIHTSRHRKKQTHTGRRRYRRYTAAVTSKLKTAGGIWHRCHALTHCARSLCSTRQHTQQPSAYVSVGHIRQHTSAYVSIRQHTWASGIYIYVSIQKGYERPWDQKQSSPDTSSFVPSVSLTGIRQGCLSFRV